MGNKVIYFISTNEGKIIEVRDVMKKILPDVEIKTHDLSSIQEIQSKDMEEIVRDKAMKAYKKLQRPLLVEHTGLKIKDFGDLPGGLTQVFWSSFLPPVADNMTDAEKLAANLVACEEFCKHFGGKEVIAETWIAFCDGKQLNTYHDNIEGMISTAPLGESLFQWDPVFVPKDYTKSFAQMRPDEKNEISMRRKALDQLAKYLVEMIKNDPDYLSEATDQHISEIKGLMKAKQLVLFIGSGVSRPLQLPSWSELIGQLAKELGYNDPDVFTLYGDNLTLAEYYKIKKNPTGKHTPLSNWMQKNLAVDETRINSSDIHKEIANLGCSVIYTTNYEAALEEAVKAADKIPHTIVTVDDLATAPADAIQILKFHGDMGDEKSIVLAEQDYFKRLSFDTPLDIKLRADMLSKSFLFLGYSMSDINIRLLSYKLNQLWKESRDTTKRPKSYIFMAQPNPIQEAIFQDRGITPIVGKYAEPKDSLLKFLKALNG